MSKKKGLIVDVFRNARGSDCTNGGVSSRFAEALLIGEGVEGPFEENCNRLTLYFEMFHNKWPRCVPDEKSSKGEGHTNWMFGGNFVYSSDSRFPSDQPIPIHDRQETWKQYEALTQ